MEKASSADILSLYPSSSSSLAQFLCFRILWLSRDDCSRMASLPSVNTQSRTPMRSRSARRGAPVNLSVDLISTSCERIGVPCSAYERRLRGECVQKSSVHAKQLRAAFPECCDYYQENALLYFSFVGSPCVERGDNLDSHTRTSAVIVVLTPTPGESCASLQETLQRVSKVFQSQYSHCVCRCLLVDISTDMQDVNSTRTFVSINSTTPCEDVAATIMEEIAVAVVHKHNTSPLMLKGAQGKTENSILPTPLDRLHAFRHSAEEQKKGIQHHRITKMRGDVALQLGAVYHAIAAYGDTQFASKSDPLWCSATLEAIAAARYRQFLPFLTSLPELNRILMVLQSESTTWDSSLTGPIGEIEATVLGMQRDHLSMVSAFKEHSVPNSMRQRLVREVTEPLAVNLADFEVVVRRALSISGKGVVTREGSTEDPSALGAQLRKCVGGIIRLVYLSVEILLKEALRQLRQIQGDTQELRVRILEAHLQLAGFLAETGQRSSFLQVLQLAREVARTLGDDTDHRVTQYLAFLCGLCGCRRKAIALVVELAQAHRRRVLLEKSIQYHALAALLSGVEMNIPELTAGLREDPLRVFLTSSSDRCFHTSRHSVPSGSLPIPESQDDWYDLGCDSQRLLTSGQGHTPRTLLLHVPLLLDLLDVLKLAGSYGGVRCRLALLLLFQYASHINRSTQESLLGIAREDAAHLDFLTSPTPTGVPLLIKWEALPLAPHLAPRTVPVSGPFFTFIDTERMKLTVLSLNGKKLNSSVVWSVGDVGSVMLTLSNPLQCPLSIKSLALQCRCCTDLDEHNNLPQGAVSYTTGPLAPVSYAVLGLHIPPLSKSSILVHVQPNASGYILVDGVELQLAHMPAATPCETKLPSPLGIPVLQRLPHVSCTVSCTEVEIFVDQRIPFSVRLVNCGLVPIGTITLSAHSDVCQLDDCEGCKERRSREEVVVQLEKSALEFTPEDPFCPGEILDVQASLYAPSVIHEVASHYIVFRVDCSLQYEKPSIPAGVPSAVPVFGVIPRRVIESRLRVFLAPSIAVTLLALSRDGRYVELRIANRSDRYSVELQLSALDFLSLPDAFILPRTEYVAPRIEIASIREHMLAYHVPWVVRDIPGCNGVLRIDFSVFTKEVVCLEPLDECVLTITIDFPSLGLPSFAGRQIVHLNARHNSTWVHAKGCSPLGPSGTAEYIYHSREDSSATSAGGHSTGNSVMSQVPFDEESVSGINSCMATIPAVTSVLLQVEAVALWKRAVPLHVAMRLEHDLDAGLISGPVDYTAPVGDEGRSLYKQCFELFALKTGEQVLHIVITDCNGREIIHKLRLCVKLSSEFLDTSE